MANIVITSEIDLVFVDFGDYAGSNVPQKRIYNKKRLYSITLEPNNTYVYIIIEGEAQLNLSYQTTTGCMIVDSVDGVQPNDNEDLNNLLTRTFGKCLVASQSAKVTCAATTTALVAENQKRKGLVLVNTGVQGVFLGFGEDAVLNQGIYMAANGGEWSMDEFTFTKEAVNGITAQLTSNVSIQEFE